MEQVREEFWYGALGFFLPTVKLKQNRNAKSRPECEVTAEVK